MSRLLYLTAVLVSITCCSLLSSATAEDTKLVQLGKEETLALGHSRDIREAGNGKNLKNKNDKNGERGKRPKKRRNGNKKLSRKDKKGSRKRQNERKRNISLKRQRQRTKQKKNREEKKRSKGKKDKKKDKKNRGQKDRPRSEKRKKRQKKRRTQQGRNGKNAKVSPDVSDSCVQKLNHLLTFGNKRWKPMFLKGRRAKANNDITWNKFKKRVNFYRPFYYLTRALGGVVSNPMCRNIVADENKEKQYLTTLQNCDSKLKSECLPLLLYSEELVMKKCKASYEALNNLVYTGIPVDPVTSANDACLNAMVYPGETDLAITEVQTCFDSMETLETNTLSLKTKCFDAFKECRIAERKVPRIASRCRLVAETAPLARLIESTISANIIAKRSETLKERFPWTGIGSWNWKQTGETDACLAILETYKAFNVSAMAATQSVEGPTDIDALDQVISALESIEDRNQLEEELFACKNATDASVFEQISSYLNWSMIWIKEVVEPKIEYLTELQNNKTTCSTPSTVNTAEVTNSTSDSTSTPTVTTVSPALSLVGRRAHFLKEMKKLKIL